MRPTLSLSQDGRQQAVRAARPLSDSTRRHQAIQRRSDTHVHTRLLDDCERRRHGQHQTQDDRSSMHLCRSIQLALVAAFVLVLTAAPTTTASSDALQHADTSAPISNNTTHVSRVLEEDSNLEFSKIKTYVEDRALSSRRTTHHSRHRTSRKSWRRGQGTIGRRTRTASTIAGSKARRVQLTSTRSHSAWM